MASVALSVDQKEIVKASSKFAGMLRDGATRKANFWLNLDTVNGMGVLGGATAANYTRWRKSYEFAIGILSNPLYAEQNVSFIAFFMQNLTQNVWDNVGNPLIGGVFTSVVADNVVLNMEANTSTLVDPAMDATFDSMIKFSS